MKRKIAHILFMLVLMVSTTGYTLTKHYCGNDLVDVSITGNVDRCCDMEGGCCHDESQTFQLQVDYTSPIVTDHVDYFSFVTFEIPVLQIGNPEKSNTLLAGLIPAAESPPPKEVSLFLADIQVYRL